IHSPLHISVSPLGCDVQRLHRYVVTYEITTILKRRHHGTATPQKGIANNITRLRATSKHTTEELHWLLRGILWTIYPFYRPNIRNVTCVQLSLSLRRKKNKLMTSSVVVAHPDIHLVPNNNIFYVKNLT